MSTQPDFKTLEQARVMIAHAHGAEVEIDFTGDWQSILKPLNWDWQFCNYRVSPDWLNVPEGHELVPLGEAVEGPKMVRMMSHYDEWFSGNPDTCYENSNPTQFVARPIAKPEPKLQLREGAWYKRRDGKIVGPAQRYLNIFTVSSECYSVTSKGAFISSQDCTSPYDLIEEVPAPEPRKSEDGSETILLTREAAKILSNGTQVPPEIAKVIDEHWSELTRWKEED